MSKESKYKIEEKPRSFTITSDRDDRLDVEVSLTDDFQLHVQPMSSKNWLSEQYSLLEFNDIVNRVSRIILHEWEKPDDDDKNWFPGLNGWVRKQNAKALNHRIHDQWERLLEHIDDKVIDVHKACYHHLFRQPDIICDKRLYKYDQLVENVQEYGACAVALNNLDYLGQNLLPKIVSTKKYNEMLNETLKRSSYWDSSSDEAIEKFWSEQSMDNKLQFLRDNWKNMFSDTGEIYEELDKTIDNLPGNLSQQSVLQLPRIHLQRPLTNRLEFIFVIRIFDKKNEIPEQLMFATEEEIREGIDIYNEHRDFLVSYIGHDPRELGCASTADIGEFVSFIGNRSDNLNNDVVSIMKQIKKDALVEEI